MAGEQSDIDGNEAPQPQKEQGEYKQRVPRTRLGVESDSAGERDEFSVENVYEGGGGDRSRISCTCGSEHGHEGGSRLHNQVQESWIEDNQHPDVFLLDKKEPLNLATWTKTGYGSTQAHQDMPNSSHDSHTTVTGSSKNDAAAQEVGEHALDNLVEKLNDVGIADKRSGGTDALGRVFDRVSDDQMAARS